MKKLCAGLFVACYVVMTAVVHGATIEFDGKTLECPKKSNGVFRCDDNGVPTIVVDTGSGFAAISGNPDKHPTFRIVDKVTNDGRVLFEISEYYETKQQDSKVKRLNDASTVISSLKDVKDDLAQSLVKDAREYLKNNRNSDKELNLTVANNPPPYACVRGETKKPSKNEQSVFGESAPQCDYYACQKEGSDEKVLAYFPTGYSFQSPSVMVMKGGQAKLISGDFKAVTKDGLPFIDEEKAIDEESLMDPRLSRADIDPSLMVPSKYEESKSSFGYMVSLNDNNFTQETVSFCASDNVKKLFELEKKTGKEMKDHLAEAELVEYLKMVDGNIGSYYVDKKKGQALGCLYQGKIVDSSVIKNFDHLKDIAVPKPVVKYLSVDEVQKLFADAKSMKDIPFGYKYDGCYARAHIMARRFEQMGIAAQKVWIKGELSVPGTDIQWNYHVAPVVEVKDTDGKIVKYVIDPSLTDKAVTVDEWVAKMDKGNKGPVMKTTYPFPHNGGSFDRTVVAISSAEPFGPVDMKEATEEQKMTTATAVLKEYSAVLAAHGGK